MSADPRWLRIQELFDTASTWPHEERSSRLTELERDAAVRAEVLGLLEASEAESRCAPPEPTRLPLPISIGGWRVLRLAGAGGRGRVFEAERNFEGVRQRAAVKIMLEHLIAPADLQRFEREQRALASLDHVSIPRFVEAGWDEGRPYLAMDWVDGVPIHQYCRDKPVRERLRLMADVLDALQAAHQNLVVHLDLKPSNVLVDSAGRVRVLDFGTAKLLGERDATSTQQMTPRYASPERLRGEPVSTSCDIYSAGLLLHEILTGNLPFRDSNSVASLGERAAGTASLSVRTGERDLDAIVLKALLFEPSKRYASAAEFAKDLQAFLQRRPVSARRPTVSYFVRRFLARNPLAAAAMLATLAALGYAAWQQRQSIREAERSRQVAGFLQWMINSSAVPGSGRPEMTVAELVQRGHRRIMRGTPLPDDLAAEIQADFAHLTREHGREDLAEPMARDAAARADRSGNAAAQQKARAALASILMRTGRCAQAVTLLQVSAQPALPDYLVARAAAAEQCEGNTTEAIRWIEAALRAEPSTTPSLDRSVFRSSLRLQEALLLGRAGRHSDALKAAEAGIAEAASTEDGRYFRVALLRMRSQLHASAGDVQAALADAREAARAAPGVVNPFEEIRMRTLLAGRMADAGDAAGAAALAREAVAEARRRAAEVGPSLWMIAADAAEVMARGKFCEETFTLYREAETLLKGEMPRTWRGNRLFFEAECTPEPRRAAALAKQALETYGSLLPAASKRRARIAELVDAGR